MKNVIFSVGVLLRCANVMQGKATDARITSCSSFLLLYRFRLYFHWFGLHIAACIICSLTLVQNRRVVSENHFQAAEIGHRQRFLVGVASLEQGGQRHVEVRFAPAAPVPWS